MVTASKMNPSTFGDEHLYFRHTRMEDDLALRPEWTPYTPKYDGIVNEIDYSGCPFANLLQYLQWLHPSVQFPTKYNFHKNLRQS